MKVLILLCVAVLPLSASAADFAGCKDTLQKIAADYRAYMSRQNNACLAELNKSSADRSTWTILRQCNSPRAELSPIKDRSSAACEECKGVDEKLGTACSSDEGVTKFLERVEAL